jgi:tyrosine-protein phosphatase 2/3
MSSSFPSSMMPLDTSAADSFFTSVSGTNLMLSTHQEPTDSFARAIEDRFDSTSVSPLAAMLRNNPSSLRTTIPPTLNLPFLTPPTPTAPASFHSPRPTPGHPNTSNTTTYNFSARLPTDLDSFIGDPNCLILDIRPHAAFSSARLPRALSLSVPSTLLKRPKFSLTKISKMLPSKSARLRFSAWSSASSILVYDAESGSVSEGSNIQGLLKKFRSEGFSADKQLAWLKGGFVSVWRERPDLVVGGPEHFDDDEEEGDQDMPGRLSLSGPSVVTEPPSFVLRTKNLSMSAFNSTSTTSQHPITTGSHYSPIRSTSAYSSASSSSRPYPLHSMNPIHASPAPKAHSPLQQPNITQPLAMAFNPFYDTVRQNIELSQGITERIPLTLPKGIRSRIDDLPFPWLRHIARRAASAIKDYSPLPSEQDSSHWLSDDPFTLDRLSDIDANSNEELVDEGAESFAMQFYRIELGEQRRLMGIMQHHSQESGRIIDSSSASSASDGNEDRSQVSKPRSTVIRTANTTRSPLFPYSITAGVEKGTKNRYVCFRHTLIFCI